jgi:hypothetical protein
MIEGLPEGEKIGDMQAPLSWIFTHTSRFYGLIIVRIQEGNGGILIDRGKPVGYYYEHDNRILKGNAAKEFFTTQRIIDFTLFRYHKNEFQHALRLFQADDTSELPSTASMISTPHEIHPKEPGLSIAQPQSPGEQPIKSLDHGVSDKDEMHAENGNVPDEYTDDLAHAEVITVHHNELAPVDLHWLGQILLGEITVLPGIAAVTLFHEDTPMLSIGDFDLEPLIKNAGYMLEAAKTISTVMDSGEFLQIILQVPGGHVIIAPYWEEYVCIFARENANLGQIRKTLKEISRRQS